MDGVSGAGMTIQLSLEILGLNVGIFRTVLDSLGLDFWDCFWTVRKLNFGTILGSPKTDFLTISGSCVLFFYMLLQEK